MNILLCIQGYFRLHLVWWILSNISGYAVVYWLRHYATSRKVAGSTPDEVIQFFSMYLIVSAAIGPVVYSASNRNEYQKQKNNVSGEQSAAGA
jgi:ABC-type uncharacterized transport system permease subunit